MLRPSGVLHVHQASDVAIDSATHSPAIVLTCGDFVYLNRPTFDVVWMVRLFVYLSIFLFVCMSNFWQLTGILCFVSLPKDNDGTIQNTCDIVDTPS